MLRIAFIFSSQAKKVLLGTYKNHEMQCHKMQSRGSFYFCMYSILKHERGTLRLLQFFFFKLFLYSIQHNANNIFKIVSEFPTPIFLGLDIINTRRPRLCDILTKVWSAI